MRVCWGGAAETTPLWPLTTALDHLAARDQSQQQVTQDAQPVPEALAARLAHDGLLFDAAGAGAAGSAGAA